MRQGVAARLGASPAAAPRRRRARHGFAACCAAVTIALLAAACGSGTASTGGSTPVRGGTATWALQPATGPDYIFPFVPGAHFTINNTNYFEYLMFRPLYWFGNRNQPTFNASQSLAAKPAFNHQTVTIKMKNWRWSDGTTVTADNVVFWLNMMKAERLNWGGYVQGAMPDNITGAKAVGDSVVFTIKGPYSPEWFTDNELSQVTPLPEAWDRTSATTKSDCTHVIADCAKVYNYLNAQSLDTKTYTSSPLWGIVDGAWKLSSFSIGATEKFTYNSKFSGPAPAQHVTTFEEVPFTTEQAEYNQLQAGNGQLDVGYLPTVDAPVPPAGSTVGANPLAGYNLSPLYDWGLNYVPYDFNSGKVGYIFQQLYVRKAIQYLVDQEGVASGPLHGYGTPSVGPVGDVPSTNYLSTTAKQGDPYALNPAAATKLLADHGWNVVPNKQTTCVNPSLCGAHIAKGQPLAFTINYESGVSWVESSMRELVSNAAEVGIKITITPQSFGDVVGDATQSDCLSVKAPSPKCTWDMANWGQGWSYSPDYLPTGENLFETGSVDNFGAFHNAHNDLLTQRTVQDSDQRTFFKVFHQWEDYLASQLPVMLEPVAPYALTETVANMRIGYQATTLMLSPEQWYFVK
jgi:peptide/nickel transport system substrate-binding protein